MANGSTPRERLVRAEVELAQLRKELELLWQAKKKHDALTAELEKLSAWQQTVERRARNYGRAILAVIAVIGLQIASGPWQRLAADILRQLARGFM